MPAMHTILHAGWIRLCTSGVACPPACPVGRRSGRPAYLPAGMALLLATSPVFAIETAPRISDREIVEGLTEIRGDIKRLEAGQTQLRGEMNARFNDMNRRFDQLQAGQTQLRGEMNARFDDINRRFDQLQWMIGLSFTVALAIFAAIVRTLWVLSRAQAAQEKINESLKSEMASLKETDFKLMDQIKALIEHLKPPKSAL
ncbi:MAG: hypothetical protein HZA21_03100 [Nitrospirae bacterium]|nr:hypothetical protein [Nitrospirota bacterium]